MKPSSLFGTSRSFAPLPVTNTIIHDITSTTPVRMAEPRFDSTPEMPTLPRMEVRLANTAEPAAYKKPARARLRRAGRPLFLDHQIRARSDAYDASALGKAQALMQEDDRQQDRQHRAGLIDRYDLVDIADLQRARK